MQAPVMKQNEAIPTPALPRGGRSHLPYLLSLLALGRPPTSPHSVFPS